MKIFVMIAGCTALMLSLIALIYAVANFVSIIALDIKKRREERQIIEAASKRLELETEGVSYDAETTATSSGHVIVREQLHLDRWFAPYTKVRVRITLRDEI